MGIGCIYISFLKNSSPAVNSKQIKNLNSEITCITYKSIPSYDVSASLTLYSFMVPSFIKVATSPDPLTALCLLIMLKCSTPWNLYRTSLLYIVTIYIPQKYNLLSQILLFESPTINIPNKSRQFTRSSSAGIFRDIRGLLHPNQDVVDVDTDEQRASQIGHADPFPIRSSGNVTPTF